MRVTEAERPESEVDIEEAVGQEEETEFLKADNR